MLKDRKKDRAREREESESKRYEQSEIYCRDRKRERVERHGERERGMDGVGCCSPSSATGSEVRNGLSSDKQTNM